MGPRRRGFVFGEPPLLPPTAEASLARQKTSRRYAMQWLTQPVSARAYVLLHFVLLAGKVGDFDAELKAQIVDEDVRRRLRRQLPSNIFVQFLAGSREVRSGVMGFLLRLIAQISLVIPTAREPDSWGFPNSRKRDSMHHIVDSRSGQHGEAFLSAFMTPSQ
jgi:hypothetical protein